MASAHEQKRLSITEAAELLGVSVDTVRRWSDERLIRHVRLPSGHRQYYREDVEAAVRLVEPAAER